PLETVYQAISLYDDVTVSTGAEAAATQDRATQDQVTVAGRPYVDLSGVPRDRSNIAVRALAETPCSERHLVHLDKAIPVAGGMAGGSADAAAALFAHERLHRRDQPDAILLAQAARLGSDVPFSL